MAILEYNVTNLQTNNHTSRSVRVLNCMLPLAKLLLSSLITFTYKEIKSWMQCFSTYECFRAVEMFKPIQTVKDLYAYPNVR